MKLLIHCGTKNASIDTNSCSLALKTLQVRLITRWGRNPRIYMLKITQFAGINTVKFWSAHLFTRMTWSKRDSAVSTNSPPLDQSPVSIRRLPLLSDKSLVSIRRLFTPVLDKPVRRFTPLLDQAPVFFRRFELLSDQSLLSILRFAPLLGQSLLSIRRLLLIVSE